jgi:pyruvate/2-oxoglutarate dehydrogenase complex dihydrolipoamide dehydrogenase (E3) component
MAVSVLPYDADNARLVASVHPPDWVNPSPAARYNLVVLGGGPAGLVAAAGAAGLGAKVALVERHLLGGDCLNVGCVPSKALLRAARAAAAVRDAGEFGVRVPAGVHVEFAAVMERVRRVRADLAANDSAARFRGLGVDVFLGEGRFTGPDTVEVGGQMLRFRRALIATGGRPLVPPIPGLEQTGFLTNETVFTLTELPSRLAVLGAGPIGCELGQAFARLGARVTLIDQQPRVLPRDDPDAARLVEQALRRDGVELVLGVSVQGVEQRDGAKVLRLDGGKGGEVEADAILVATGRRPAVGGLNLEAAGVAYDARQGVHVSDRLRTTNPRVYAAGDVCSHYQFTHAADAMARLVLRNALFPFGRGRVSALTIPWCTYTDPEVAHVGLSEEEAKQKGVAVRAFVQELRDVDRAVIDGEAAGFARVLVRAGTDRIIGATVVAAHAGAMIAEVTLAMTARLGLRALADTIHPYPTQAEALKKVGDAYGRTRLTPRVRWLFEKWLSWTR